MEKCMGVTDEVLRKKKKKKRKKESSRTFWSLEEWQGGKKENKERVRLRVWRRKKVGEKKERNAECGG